MEYFEIASFANNANAEAISKKPWYIEHYHDLLLVGSLILAGVVLAIF